MCFVRSFAGSIQRSIDTFTQVHAPVLKFCLLILIAHLVVMAQARPVSTEDQDTLQLLRLTGEIAPESCPALQGMAASALWIMSAVAV